VRQLAVVGPGDEIEDALAAMQRSGAHLARVDDAGAAVGVVFLEDILEELVGEVRDAMQRGQLPNGR
jgi:CBS domain containing-hemolysin-like protein